MTTTIHAHMTLGALVNANPELAREFERRGMDYCCGGGQPLADACADQRSRPDGHRVRAERGVDRG